MLAIDERNEWREALQRGEVPAAIRQAATLYAGFRDRPDWRATRHYEAMGEAALILIELLDKQRINTNT